MARIAKTDSLYRWPAEWETHGATWIAWPHERSDWPGKFAAIPWVYAEMVRHLAQSERVGILVGDAAEEKRAQRILGRNAVDLTRVDFRRIATDRVWTRDFGPIFVTAADGAKVALDWRFNGWAKYDNFRRDDAATFKLAKMEEWKRIEPKYDGRSIVLEGGSIDGNGGEVILTTEECLLSEVQQRNPGLTKDHYERIFAEFLGARKVLWLNRGIAGDDTHGHVDDLARFVGQDTIVTVVESNPADENYRPLQENLDRLRGFTNLEGRPFDIVQLPMPDPVIFAGRRLPASYANFYIANDRVLVPTFNAPTDRVALGILADVFPGRKVIGIHAADLVWGLGTLHCMTQQEPASEQT
jgi:agmatine deiminase